MLTSGFWACRPLEDTPKTHLRNLDVEKALKIYTGRLRKGTEEGAQRVKWAFWSWKNGAICLPTSVHSEFYGGDFVSSTFFLSMASLYVVTLPTYFEANF